MKFHVYVGGDRSVGLQDINATVDFKDRIIWDADMVQDMKQMLADFYDTTVSSVLTHDEYIADQAAIFEQERKLFNL
jgi:hypothetical protein